jgi:hypothetical protein
MAFEGDANHIRMVVERFYADIWNRHDKTKIPTLLRPRFTFRGSLGQAKVGHDGFASYVDFVHESLEGFRCDILDLVIEPLRACASRVRIAVSFSGFSQRASASNGRGPLSSPLWTVKSMTFGS